MVRGLLIILTLLTTAFSATPSKSSHKQRDVLHQACQHGKEISFKGQDMCYVMAAIAWRESEAGRALVSYNGSSVGVFQNRIETVQRRYAQEGIRKTRAVIKQELMNINHSAKWAKIELKYWLGRRNNLEIAIRSYNAGNKHINGRRYANDVLALAKWLERNKYPMGLY